MIRVTVKSNTDRATVTVEATDTPNAAFAAADVNPASSVCNLNGTILSATDLNSSFEQLGVSDGTTCNLNAIVKADGAYIR